MFVEYVNHMGDDLMVVNSARVSFNKHKDKFTKQDERLIKFLAEHNHWTPFGHPTITVRVKTPIFVARQLFKHKVGMVENEVSRRYVDDTPEFFVPKEWRGRPTDGAKQGSSKEEFKEQELVDGLYSSFISDAEKLYNKLIKLQIAPEQARMILPQSMYTEWYWTGSLASFSRIYKLRSDPHAQLETQEIADMISNIVRPLFPISWSALVD